LVAFFIKTNVHVDTDEVSPFTFDPG